jgi:hypothetical protein
MRFNLLPRDVIASAFHYFPEDFVCSMARSTSDNRTSISSISMAFAPWLKPLNCRAYQPGGAILLSESQALNLLPARRTCVL